MALDLFSMIVGGILVVAGQHLYRQIQSGNISIPPLIKIGPIRIDLSEIAPAAASESAGDAADEGSTKKARHPLTSLNSNFEMPKLNVGSPPSAATGGWLAALGGGAVLFGFVMPWFFCNIGFISGSVSGLSALIQLIWGVVLAFLGSLLGIGGNSGALAGLGIVTLLLLLIPIYILILVPLSGWRIGTTGYNLTQGSVTTTWALRSTSKYIIRTAIIGLVPMAIYLVVSSTGFDFRSLGFLGFYVGRTEIGVLLVIGGFALAILAGMMVGSVATAREAAENAKKQPPPRARSASELDKDTEWEERDR